MTKLKKFIASAGYENIEFMQNNAFVYKNIVLCGTRGWIHPAWDGFKTEDRKIFDRETERMALSLKNAFEHIQSGECTQIYAFMHYPPMSLKAEENEMTAILKKFNVSKVFYGHLHGASHRNAVSGIYNDTEYRLVSADYLQFVPFKIAD